MTPGNWITIAAVSLGYIVSAAAFIVAIKSKLAVLDEQIKSLRKEIGELRAIFLQDIAVTHRMPGDKS